MGTVPYIFPYIQKCLEILSDQFKIASSAPDKLSTYCALPIHCSCTTVIFTIEILYEENLNSYRWWACWPCEVDLHCIICMGKFCPAQHIGWTGVHNSGVINVHYIASIGNMIWNLNKCLL